MMANFGYCRFPDPFLNVTVRGSPGQIKNVLSIKQVYTKVRTPRKKKSPETRFLFSTVIPSEFIRGPCVYNNFFKT